MDAIKIRAKPVLAEFVAMTLFVYVGCGSVFSFNQEDPLDKLAIALAFGLSITSLAYTVGHVSGTSLTISSSFSSSFNDMEIFHFTVLIFPVARSLHFIRPCFCYLLYHVIGGHMNPLVTVGACILGQLDLVSGVFYIIAQLLGSTVAALLLSLGLVNDNNSIADVVNGINRSTITPAGAFVMETILSFLLMYVVAETAINKKSGAGNCAPIAIGIAVFMAHIVAIPFTGCSINPARSFGPAVVAGNLNDLWLFFAAPILGGILAAVSCKYIFGVLDNNMKVVEDGGEKLQYDRLFTPATDAGTAAEGKVPVPVPESSRGDLSFPISMAPLEDEAINEGLENSCETP